MPLKVVLAAVLAILMAMPWIVRGDELKLEAAPAEDGLNWRCNEIHGFQSYCNAIKRAVEGQAASASAPATATSHEAATRIALDFGGKTLLGKELADLLLAADSLLPNHLSIIEIRNLLLHGALELNRTAFRRALTLDELHFADGQGACAEDAGISIEGSQFDKQVRLSRVSGCGSLYLVSSHFAGGLLLDDEISFGSEFNGRIIINQSQIRRQLFINNWIIGSLNIALSSFDSVTLRNMQVLQRFQFRDSDVFSLSSYRISLPSQASVRGNRVRDSVNLSEIYIASASSDQRAMHIADNEVAGRLVIGIRDRFGRDNPPSGSRAGGKVTLMAHHNVVGGSADVFIEEGLPAVIDLRGSKFAAELLLTRACMADGQEDKAAELSACQKRCGFISGFCAVDPSAPMEEGGRAEVDVQLTAVEVDTLVWNLKGNNVTWSGPGLRYTYWDPELRYGQRPYQTRSAVEGGGNPLDPMRAWLAQLKRGPDAVDPWTFGAAYLKAHGHVAEAADTRLVALRSNLVNKIKTESNPVSVTASSILFLALAPVGWGARPEWALLLMTILVFAFWALYHAHSRRSERRKWPNENWHLWEVKLSRLHLQDAVTEVVAAITNGRHAAKPAELEPPPGPPPASDPAKKEPEPGPALRASVGIAQQDPPAYSLVPGFNQYNNTFPPRRFSLFLFSLDAMLPVISLHHFDRYYPFSIEDSVSGAEPQAARLQLVRMASIAQHGIGWWLSTVFVASLFV